MLIALASRLAASDDKPTVRHPAVVRFQLFLCDKSHCRIILVKIIRHSFDRLLNRRPVCPVLSNYITFSQMLISCGKLWLASAPYIIHYLLNRNRVLNGILNPVNTPDCIGVPLAHALAPECIRAALGQYSLRIQAV